MPKLKMSHAKGEVADNTFDDIQWVRDHWQTLLKQYGEVSILVYQQAVIGVGNTYAEAIANAENQLSDDSDTPVTPIHERLRPRLRLHRMVRQESST
jgi:hypothetical protein